MRASLSFEPMVFDKFGDVAKHLFFLHFLVPILYKHFVNRMFSAEHANTMLLFDLFRGLYPNDALNES